MTEREGHAISKLSRPNTAPSLDLSGKRVLIVEDEFLVADEMARDLKGYGAEVVGPVGSLDAAQAAVSNEVQLDGAILDINLRGEIAFELIDALRAREVPCVVVTGYDEAIVPVAYQDVPFRHKPMETIDIVRTLFG